jgi:WD40 repeat protein
MSDLPTGTVTFLFTDIEGSTHLLQQLGYQYVTVLTESRRLLRTAFQQFHGYEVDTQGDSVFVAFPCACDAVSAAVLAQRLLFAYPWPQDVKETSVHVWEAMTGRVLLTYRGHVYWVRALAWSPNGKLLASGALKEVQVWEVSSRHKVFTFHRHEGWVKAVAWSPDGTRLASTGEDNLVQVWKPGKDYSLLTFRGHTDWVGTVEWSPDSKHIASISKDHVLKIWNATTGRDILTFRYNDNAIHAIAWLPDGKHLVSVNDRGVVQIWQVQSDYDDETSVN